MRRFLNKLVSDFRSTKAARSARRAPRRAPLQVEGLEDRLVLSTATLTGSTLLVNASPGAPIIVPLNSAILSQPFVNQVTFQADPAHAGELQVLDHGALVGGKEFAISSIKTVKVSVAGLDAVNVNDSNGFPFAAGTTISLSGSGLVNSLRLTGSRTISGGETYTAGNGSQPGSLTLGGTTFEFGSTIGSVTDAVTTPGTLVVKAFGQKVSLSGTDGVTQTLSGLSNGGAGDSLTYTNKPLVDLKMLSANANASLNATAAAAGEHSFAVELIGNQESLNINATPSGVPTTVTAAAATVELNANSAPVTINGNSTTLVNVGVQHSETTSGIQANVFINGAASILVDDTHNATTQEHVTVTESTVSGTGLFGNNAAVLRYSGLAIGPLNGLTLDTGRLHNTYEVTGSQKGARFTPDKIVIVDRPSAPSPFSPIATNGGLDVRVTVDSGSGLNLSLFDDSEIVNGSLSISAVGGTFNPSAPSFDQGTETVTFGHRLFPGLPIIGLPLTSTVSYSGFRSISLS